MTNHVEVFIDIAASPEAVFETLTTPGALEAWFAEHAEVDLAAGRYTFWGRYTPGTPHVGTQHLLSAAAPTELRFRWPLSGGESSVTVTLEPRGDGTRVRVHHDGVPTRDEGEPAMADYWCLALQNLRGWMLRRDVAIRADVSNPPDERIEFVVETKASPAEVFDALTDPAQLNRWIAEDAKVGDVTGGVYDFGWGSGPLKILDLAPGERLSYAWKIGDEPETVVTWELEGSGGATRITFVHSGFGDRPDPGYLLGWADFVARLKYLCDEGASWVGPHVVRAVKAPVR